MDRETRFRVNAILKPTINDPEGNAIKDALHSLGFDSVVDVRTGKYFEANTTDPNVDLSSLVAPKQREISGMPSKVLYNYSVEMLEPTQDIEDGV